MHLKRFVVRALEELDEILRHHPYPCKLALLSCELDERWGTGVWRKIDPAVTPNPFPWFSIFRSKS